MSARVGRPLQKELISGLLKLAEVNHALVPEEPGKNMLYGQV